MRNQYNKKWMCLLTIVMMLEKAQLAKAQECDELAYVPYPAQRTNWQGPCSGHGTCDQINQQCECFEGWTGRSDIINTEGIDCHIYKPAIQGLWGFNLLVCLLASLKIVPLTYQRYKQYAEVRKVKKAAGKKFGLWKNRGLVACLVAMFVMIPTIMLQGILRIITDQRIGFDIPITLSFAIGKIAFYGAIFAFQPALLSTILKGKSSTRKLVKVADRLTGILCTWAALMGCSPIVLLFTNENTGSVNLVVWYCVNLGTALQLVLFGSQAWYIRHAVTKVLTESFSLTKETRILTIRDALNSVQNETIKQAIVQGTIYASFAFVGFLFNCHDWFLPIGWLAYIILGLKVAKTHVRNTRNTSTAGGTSSVAHSKNEHSKSDGSKLDGTTNTMMSSYNTMTQQEASFVQRAVSFHESPVMDSDAEEGDDGWA